MKRINMILPIRWLTLLSFGLIYNAVPQITTYWSFDMIGRNGSESPAIGPDGTIYVGDSEGNVYAVNPNGIPNWSKNIKSFYEQENYLNGVPISLVNALPNGFDLNSVPDAIWYPLNTGYYNEDFYEYSPTLSKNGKILYLATRIGGKILALDSKTGNQLWEFNVRNVAEVKADSIYRGGGFVSEPAIGPGGAIYIGSGDWWGDQWKEAMDLGIDVNKVTLRKFADRRLYALNSDGSLKWIFSVEPTDTYRETIWGAPAITNDTIYFASFNGKFYAIKDEGSQGRELWSYEVTGGALTNYQEFWSAPAIGSDGTIYIGNNDFNIHAINSDGSLKWKFPTGSEVYQCPIIGVNDVIYVASEDGSFYAINRDGQLIWKKSYGGIPDQAVFTEDEKLLLAFSGGNKLLAINSSDGEIIWEHPVSMEQVTIDKSGVIYGVGVNQLHAISGQSSSLSKSSPWPKYQKDLGNHGNSNLGFVNDTMFTFQKKNFNFRKRIKVYNKSKTTLVSVELADIDKDIDLQVLDIRGKVLYVKHIKGNVKGPFTFEINSFLDGVYIIRLNSINYTESVIIYQQK